MTLLLVLLIVVVLMAVFGGMAGPTIIRRRPATRVVRRSAYVEPPVETEYVETGVVEEEIVEDVPVTRTRRRRVVGY